VPRDSLCKAEHAAENSDEEHGTAVRQLPRLLRLLGRSSPALTHPTLFQIKHAKGGPGLAFETWILLAKANLVRPKMLMGRTINPANQLAFRSLRETVKRNRRSLHCALSKNISRRGSRTADPSAALPRIPVEVSGVDGPHAPFLKRKAHTQSCPVPRGRKSGSG